MSIDEFDFDEEEYEVRKNGELPEKKIIEKIKKEMNHEFIEVRIDFNGYNYSSNLEFKKTKEFINNIISLSKEKSNKKYKLEIVSKGDYFLIYTDKNMFKIDKSDIIHIGIDDSDRDTKLVFELKDKVNEVEILLKASSFYENDKSIRINVVCLLKEDKILEFLFSELYEYIERKTNSTYL